MVNTRASVEPSDAAAVAAKRPRLRAEPTTWSSEASTPTAGIPHYWIVDLDEPVSLLDCHLAEGFGYQDGGSITGAFTTSEPSPVRLQLGQLL